MPDGSSPSEREQEHPISALSPSWRYNISDVRARCCTHCPNHGAPKNCRRRKSQATTKGSTRGETCSLCPSHILFLANIGQNAAKGNGAGGRVRSEKRE
ncbi:DUF678 domain-containing protein [Pseudorhodobacter sp. E13]|nr:DUF678 domain-containing protein [Pseudorhodobacter sp. E13]